MNGASSIIQAAEAELRLAGLCPAAVQADGRKYRCPVEGQPKGLDGEYRIYADERPTLVWRNYRTGQHGSKPLVQSEPTGNDDPSDRAREMWAKAAPALGSHAQPGYPGRSGGY